MPSRGTSEILGSSVTHVRCALRVNARGALEHRDGERCRAWTMGAWVAGLASWSYFVTLTWGDPTVRRGSYSWEGERSFGVGHVERSWSRWVEAFKPSTSWAAMESHQFRSTPHMHAVVDGLGAFDVEESCTCAAARNRVHMRVWCQTKVAFGRCKIESVRSSLDAACYVAKYVNKGLGKVYVSGLAEGVVPPDPRDARLWAEAVRNAELVERDEADVRLLAELHASNVELGARQARFRSLTLGL